MITVCLYGDLRRFGRRFLLHVETPAEALRALFTQFDGMAAHMRERHYQVRFGGEDMSEESVQQVFTQNGEGVLHIVPRAAGAGKVGQIVLGAVMIVAAFWTGGASMAAWGAFSTGLFMGGVSMILGGVAQLLTKPPSFDMGKQGQAASRNTAFSNLDNTAAQGQPVPLAYGRVYCGSRVVSQGIESRRVDTNNPAAATYPSASDAILSIGKVFNNALPAKAPNGSNYAVDAADDSVKARNYISKLGVA